MPQMIELIIVSPTLMGTLVHSVLFRYDFVIPPVCWFVVLVSRIMWCWVTFI